MRRPSQNELSKILKCVECGCDIIEISKNQNLECCACGVLYSSFRKAPVLMCRDNALFPPREYRERVEGTVRAPSKSFLAKTKRVIPSKSVNVAREGVLQRISAIIGDSSVRILVVGCGNQTSQLKRLFSSQFATFVFCDVDKGADVDVFCDSHTLPFKSGVFDGVISTAVLEHVLVPDRVVDEIHRVLSDDGFIYSEIPFLQSVHEGAYDFTRFSLSGHRRLMDRFSEVEAGMVAGPGTALLWSLVDFFRCLSTNTRISQAFSIVIRTSFFWLKYTDYYFKKQQKANDAASCTYFFGLRLREPVLPSEIISRYSGNEFSHT